MKSLSTEDFSLRHTLESGQLFRFQKINDYYYVNTRGKFFKIKQENDTLSFTGVSPAFVKSFFRLDEDLNKVARSISKDVHVMDALNEFWGMRIMRQDPWECMVSFICSQAANIPKIKMNVNLLSQFFGEKMVLEDIYTYSFPRPTQLRSMPKLLKAKTGFRASYLHDLNQKVDVSFIKQLKRLSYSQAKEELMKLKGVGEKVADCILLFSLDHTSAFPIDTWMTKGMKKVYFNNKDVPRKDAIAFAQKYFGKNAGYAQQYLFHHWRVNGIN